MVLPADHMRHRHQRIVNHDRDVVRRRALRAHDHGIANHVGRKADLAANGITEDDVASLGHPKTDRRFFAGGNPVMGDGGPINVPQSTQMNVGADGTISVLPMGQTPETISAIGRIKLVNPAAADLSLGSDGLMHLADGASASADPAVTIKSGVLESSNVNPSQTLVQMIQLSRQYELQVRAIKSADENAQSASRLLQVG